MANKNNIPDEAQSLSELLQIRRDKLTALQDAGRDPFTLTKYNVTHHTTDILEHYEALEEQVVSVAGRIMFKRGMGKVCFCGLQDKVGQIQIYVRKDLIGEEEYSWFKKWDIGDIIGVTGHVFKTKTGETSVRADEVKLLSKSLLPLPEKFHGLTDKELRYRQRYVDLIMNPDVRNTFALRSQFIKYLREFLDNRGYMEVETPVLNTISGGATARPFITHHNTLDIDMYMRIATELHLKRLIVGGLEKVYEVGRIFRNEGMDTRHNPEFTTVELYEAYADFNDMMDLMEDFLSSAAMKLLGTYKVSWLGEEVDLAPGWARLPMHEAVKQYLGIDFMSISTDEEAEALAKSVGVELGETTDKTWGNYLYACFDQKVEGLLVQPTFITMHPVDVSPLSKRSPADPRLTERFELFICRSEMGNAFSELNDPIDQKERFQKQVEMRAKGDDEAGMMDEDFINALEYGMPPTGGMGIGIDRCVMLLSGSDSIRDVLLFPTMKPLDLPAKPAEKKADAPKAEAPKAESAPAEQKAGDPVAELKDNISIDDFAKLDLRVCKVVDCVSVESSRNCLKLTLNDGLGERTIVSSIKNEYTPDQLIGKKIIVVANLEPKKLVGIMSNGMLLAATNSACGCQVIMVDDSVPEGTRIS